MQFKHCERFTDTGSCVLYMEINPGLVASFPVISCNNEPAAVIPTESGDILAFGGDYVAVDSSGKFHVLRSRSVLC